MNTVAPVLDQAPDVSPACCETDESGAPGMSAARATAVAAILKALADPVRLRLYSRIAAAAEPVCVCDIDDVGVSQPTVSHHLRKLREAGLIASERRGTWVYYSPVPGATAVAYDALQPGARADRSPAPSHP
ncbi:ArsR/SmtB family transcription factor [Nocardioides sp. CPCC 205120]|uniref:ArsR/SmtB family transcription factor n=1 Tax=Nocardioides sp. CPCC 205120 TaxID=3406462 RepID=UPI003B50C388